MPMERRGARRERTFQSVLTSQPVALLRWLKVNEPESLERTQYVFGVKDYIRYRMTGAANGERTDFSARTLSISKPANTIRSF